MDVNSKLRILSDAAKYDVSCASSGSRRKNNKGGLGNAEASGICHSFADDGRCISLLKILMSNECAYNCSYCINRISSDITRTTFTPLEITRLTSDFYKRNYIEGLFLSSAVYKSPDFTMELFIEILKLLRHKYGFNGYIHVKAIPGADLKLVESVGRLADRMSVNIELPSETSLRILAPQKKIEAISRPMEFLSNRIKETRYDYSKSSKSQIFVPAGQSTQMIIGASPESDYRIITTSEHLYKKFGLKRVYYSAYVPVSDNPNLPAVLPPLLREHRLYQADWLLRYYGFNAGELLDKNNQYFNNFLDPKCDWAIRNLQRFPVEVNKAEPQILLRVPGIGHKSTRRIMMARKSTNLTFDDLKKLGVVMKRARFFITCNGRYFDSVKNMNEMFIYENIMAEGRKFLNTPTEYIQPSLFEIM